MTPDRLFSICNTAALLAWIVLAIFGRRRWAAPLVTGFAIPLLFGVVYAAMVVVNFGKTPGGFGSLSGVESLFTNPWMLLAGWIHYLAFDLFIGSWEVRDAQARGIPQLAVIPALFLTFMFGPAGLVLYFMVRAGLTRTAALQPDRAVTL